MFEKEAEEYVLENFSSDYYGEFEMEEITEYSAFQKGAEFGYKEGIKTLDNMTRAFNREHKKYTDLRIANEWHYVKDGDLPKVETWVIGFYYGVDNWHKIFYRADGHWWGEGQLCQPPYAWKEIVLPELKESE